MHEVEFEPKALKDLDRESRYLSQRNLRAERRWIQRIAKAVLRLKSAPHSFPEAAEAESLGLDLRELQIGPKRKTAYRILFIIADDTVRILRIRHSAQDAVTSDDL